MSAQLGLALQARDEGIEAVSLNNAEFLAAARSIAVELAAAGPITCDDVRAECERQGIEPLHYNAWGAVFSGGCGRRLRFTGKLRKSRQLQGHGNLLRVWELA